MPDFSELPVWELHLTLQPSADGRFCKSTIEFRKAESRMPTYVNEVSSTDMLYEKLQGELNNTLRTLVNDIHQQVVKPNKHNRR